VRFSEAKFKQAMECGWAAPLAQQALSPANALDAANIAAATKAAIILIMVSRRYARREHSSICFLVMLSF